MPSAAVGAIMLTSLATLAGFCSSAPLGAINLWVTDRVLERRQVALTAYLIGVIGADGAHALIAAWGYHAFFDEGPVARWLSILGGLFLVILGGLGLKHRVRHLPVVPTDGQAVTGRPLSEFLLGVFMCGANPGFLAFWVFAINQIERQTGIAVTGWQLMPFLLGIAIGDSVWFWLLLRLVRRGLDTVQPRFLSSLRLGIAAAFVLVGTFAVYHGSKMP
jgi:threonine/homoserine/homoserine lactone efflux protein